MPRYEFRCRACGSTFEVERPMARSGDPARCPHGHPDTVRLLSTVAIGGRATPSSAASSSSGPSAASGGCCGGGCCA